MKKHTGSWLRCISVLLTAAMILSVASCAESPEDSNSNVPPDTSSTDFAQERAEYLQRMHQLRNEIEGLNETISSLEKTNEEQKAQMAALKKDLNEAQRESQKGLERSKQFYEHVASYAIAPLERFIAEQKRMPEKLPEYKPGSVELDPAFSSLPYRAQYYWAYERVIRALGEVRGVDYFQIYLPDGTPDGTRYLNFSGAWDLFEVGDDALPIGDVKESSVLTVIKSFKVTREEFDQVVKILSDPTFSFYRGREIDFNEEYNEIPNADILYTFDNDIINEYYRRA